MKQTLFTFALAGLVSASLLAGGKGTVTGTYAEARTAEVFAGGCIMNSEAGTAGRQAVLAWKVDRGAVNGVALDGLSIVAAVSADKNLGIKEIGGAEASTRTAIYVDQRATVPQQAALIAMAHELSNGVVDTVVQITLTTISFTNETHAVRVSADQASLEVNKHINHDPSCGAMQWFHPLSTMNRDAAIGETEKHSFSGSSLGTKWSDPHKRSAFFGTFTY
jgi:hypothetical protein